ncbi:Hypothetical protein CINCED_3A005700 [Cinara cedri]|uniref:Uncharacterized protein n=1 Tax=Cinara cedri TaxID=506608 RepID=A0A5E4MLX5_9HEMI|nr:Hypothetical protein CINCED_3A005700 [Cinara cedri]
MSTLKDTEETARSDLQGTSGINNKRKYCPICDDNSEDEEIDVDDSLASRERDTDGVVNNSGDQDKRQKHQKMTITAQRRQNDCDTTADTTRNVDGPPLSDDDSDVLEIFLEDPIPIAKTRNKKTKPKQAKQQNSYQKKTKKRSSVI